ncbi:Atg22 family (BtlA) (PUBMED:12583894) [Commensalibacter communis]|uniref:Atg22 family (BtlA) (PUBMED:12583894) n=1 Tax=Commensalibacter communis TaxID=2972786 RepID=A0A9W4TQT1_9PROT|nr:MFS transporter [Commensalibacter communis]CAI3959591.1 Atg22 family (BtlA) (PUBMED:12583894) [Commensalibacter communis]CAI3960994.1 Atg22 family (BtlA) (PUBMED:12583894) [Commensalibacter communis]CAI3961125.1 Atg22 family (BtlA) (PUBMED:12583894) [Commensalibacter communis]CAI3961211.1 Atg22 family (BtlA) (PUBMED:12583894) [Commensalibacter communis]
MKSQKLLFGFMPSSLVWGYIAIAIFMAGDGFEAAFLSKFITDMGFSEAQSGLVFTIYGLMVAISAWCSGVVAEIITPQKAMFIGFILWSVMHVCFMIFGIGMGSYPLMVICYGIRGFGYPLFLYSFVILIIQNVDKSKVSTAMGWFWAAYSIGFGVLGGFLPGYINPIIGEYNTLWMALGWVVVGGLISLIALRNVKTDISKEKLSLKKKTEELSRAITILFSNKHIFMSALVRIINTTPIFGFAVVMPWLLVGKNVTDHGLGFTKTEWQNIWTVFMFVTIFTNVMWGILGDYIGWLRQARWFGCIGGAIACFLFYYIPITFGHNYWMVMIPAVLFGFTVAAFVPMTAVFAALEPHHQGAAISIYNLSAGLSNFVGPGIATIMVPLFGIIGAIWCYVGLYIFAAILTLFIKVDQPR